MSLFVVTLLITLALAAPPKESEPLQIEQFSVPDPVRIRVYDYYRDDVLRSLRAAGFEPEVEQAENGHVLLILRGLDEERLHAALQAVPSKYLSNRGFVGRYVPLSER